VVNHHRVLWYILVLFALLPGFRSVMGILVHSSGKIIKSRKRDTSLNTKNYLEVCKEFQFLRKNFYLELEKLFKV